MMALRYTLRGAGIHFPFWIRQTFPVKTRLGNCNHRHEKFRRRSLVLGIESSCDDTGVAVVDSDGVIVSEMLATQTSIHSQWGGVVPRLAQEAHQNAIGALIDSVFSSVDPTHLSAVAVTVGPGLSLCLRVGVERAVKISSKLGIPLIPIHHMEAHALVVRMENKVQFPFLCLLVSGGHNLLLLVHGIGRYTQIGTTLDDSLGEAYDKVARMLDLELDPSGGAAVEKEAKKGDPFRYSFKLPMQQYQNCDFSYSGLKTAVRTTIIKQFGEDNIPASEKAHIAASFQKVAIDHLCDKVSRCLQWTAETTIPDFSKTFVVSGGVASNEYVCGRLKSTVESFGFTLLSPPARLCTDNGVMVAWTGMERYRLGLFHSEPATEIQSEDDWLDLRARWPLTDHRIFPPPTPRRIQRKRLHMSLTTLTEEEADGLLRLRTEMPENYIKSNVSSENGISCGVKE